MFPVLPSASFTHPHLPPAQNACQAPQNPVHSHSLPSLSQVSVSHAVTSCVSNLTLRTGVTQGPLREPGQAGTLESPSSGASVFLSHKHTLAARQQPLSTLSPGHPGDLHRAVLPAPPPHSPLHLSFPFSRSGAELLLIQQAPR